MKKLAELDSRQSIVDEQGKPSTYLLRYLRDRGGALTELEALILQTEIIAGAGLDGGGSFANGNVTLDANTQEILDSITDVHGSILFRGASAWQALGPGTAGQVLQTNGAAANPSWAAAGGGGAFSGARVYSSSANFAVSAGSTQILSVWDTESFDVGGWWDPANPSWFTVPAGVEYAEATLQLQRVASVLGQFIGQIALYDSSDALIGVIAAQETDTSGGDSLSVSTGPFAVTAGQRIKARYFVTNTGNMDGGQYGCSFSVRGVG